MFYKRIKIITYLFLLPLFIFSQKNKPPKIVDLIIPSNWIKSKIDKKGKEFYSRKSQVKGLNGKKRINITFLNTKTDIVDSYISTNYISTGAFEKGYKTGLWKMTYKKKLVKTENWNQGLIYGKHRFYDIEGNLLYKTTFGTSGNGVYKDFYFETGILKQEGNYNNGKKQGEWCDYDVQGKLKQTTHFKNGILTTE